MLLLRLILSVEVSLMLKKRRIAAVLTLVVWYIYPCCAAMQFIHPIRARSTRSLGYTHSQLLYLRKLAVEVARFWHLQQLPSIKSRCCISSKLLTGDDDDVLHFLHRTSFYNKLLQCRSLCIGFGAKAP